MDITKVRFKVGAHEFEAEGPAEVVQEQLKAFKELIAAAPVPQTPPPRIEGAAFHTAGSGGLTPSGSASPSIPKPDTVDDIETTTYDGLQIDRALTKIMKVDHRTV